MPAPTGLAPVGLAPVGLAPIGLAPIGLAPIGLAPIGLAIDTTFDDTSIAVLRGRRQILADLSLSQFHDHQAFGGVVPERASRRHLEVIHPLIGRALDEAGTGFADLAWIAVSHKPGLLGSILVGVTVAKALALALDIPLIGINHIEAHPYACLLAGAGGGAGNDVEMRFPVVHLVVAGGHTLLIHQTGPFERRIVGRSLDDAAGECADKVARIFGLPQPGGKAIDELAMTCEPGPYSFPRPLMHQDNLDFSFSGLKTAMKLFRDRHGDSVATGPAMAAFFESVCDVLVHKTLQAAARLDVDTISVSGGLAASRRLRLRFEDAAGRAGLRLLYPPPRLCTDNAAMVACLAAERFAAGRVDDLTLKAEPNLSE
jgi:N6-L-threonylcarbamoyladenine synthase